MRTANLSRAFTAYTLFFLLFFGFGCTSLKVGESWKMLPEDETFGLTLLWELPEAKLKAMLPADQQPRIRNGKGVVMLFLAVTTVSLNFYFIKNTNLELFGVAIATAISLTLFNMAKIIFNYINCVVLNHIQHIVYFVNVSITH